jgi:hypothetical protein
MKLALPFTLIGVALILTPVGLVHYWPYARSEFIPEDLSQYPNSYYAAKDERLSSWNDERLHRHSNESDYDYAERMLETVHNATYHCEAYNFQQSWFTWLSWKTGFYQLIPSTDFGVLDLKTFRCGFCHQRSYILAKVLRLGGIGSAEVLGVTGHVVTVITINDDLYALDPDLGVGPVKVTGIDTAETALEPEIKERLYEAYQPVTEIWNKPFTDNIVDYYLTSENNEYYNFLGLDIRRLYQSILFSFERVIEVCFIIAGITLIGIGCAMYRYKVKNMAEVFQLLNRVHLNQTP